MFPYLLERELERLLESNGNLASAIEKFYKRYADREIRKDLVFFILDKLVSEADLRKNIPITGENRTEFKNVSVALMEVLKQMMKGGKEEENRLFAFCESVKKISGARVSDAELAPWARELICHAGAVIQAGRARENSADQPY